MKEASKRNVLSIKFLLKYYLHRYIRLTPPLMIMVMISLNLSKYFGSGPFFVPTGQEISNLEINFNNIFNRNKTKDSTTTVTEHAVTERPPGRLNYYDSDTLSEGFLANNRNLKPNIKELSKSKYINSYFMLLDLKKN